MNTDELRRLLATMDEPYRLLFETAAETGCRMSEVLGLAWEDIRLGDRVIHFTHQLERSRRRDRPRQLIAPAGASH